MAKDSKVGHGAQNHMNAGQQQSNAQVDRQRSRPRPSLEPEPSACPKDDRRQQGKLIPVRERPIERLRPTHVTMGCSRRKINLGGEEKAQGRRDKKNDRGLTPPNELEALIDPQIELGRVAHDREL